MEYDTELLENAQAILARRPTTFVPGSFDYCRAALLAYALRPNARNHVTSEVAMTATFDAVEGYRNAIR